MHEPVRAPSDARDIPVSVIIMTKNEVANIGPCISSVARAREVFVVDSGSTDGTQAAAAELGATVVDFAWNGKYPKKKQWCLENLPFTQDWVLYVDADERVTAPLAQEIADALNQAPAASGYFVGLDYVWEGRVLRHGDRVWKLALFRRDQGRFVEWRDLDVKNMWEVEGHYQPVVDGPTERLASPLMHDDHDALFDWFERHNRYSDWEARIRHSEVVQGRAETQTGLRGLAKRIFVRLPARPLAWFIYSYLVRSGWRDGREGFSFAVAKSFYQWQIAIKERELARETRHEAEGNAAPEPISTGS